MDTLQVIALIVVALVIVAVIIAFRKRIVLSLKGGGIDLNLEAENEGQPVAENTSTVLAGVRVEGAESTGGGFAY